MESIPWIVLAGSLLSLAWGLWNRRRWARTLALVLHWPVFVGSCVLLAASFLCLLLVPGGNIDVLRAFAQAALVGLPFVAAFSGWTLRHLYRRVDRDHTPRA
jgi:hypothetical protein